MRRAPALVVSLTLGLVVLAPESAHAAGTQLGNSCTATAPASNVTFLMTGRSGANPLPVVAPASGVVTKATITLPVPASGTYPSKLKIARPTGAANSYTIVAQSADLGATEGPHTFDVRLPIAAGDVLGLGGVAPVVCSTANAGDTGAGFAGDVPVGTPTVYSAIANFALPLVVTVEPDADGDGYGDLTQDLCPQVAASQTACPVVNLDSRASAAGGKITVSVTASASAQVSVTGVAKVNGKKIKLKGGTKTVAPGVLTQFKVKLPRSLKAALAKLPRSKKVTVTLTSSATDVVGRVTTDTAKVKLRGTK